MSGKEKVIREIRIVYSADGAYYALPEMNRECGLWLGMEKCPLPVPLELRRPSINGAAIMPGRGYWRRFTTVRLWPGAEKTVAIDDPMMADWCEASWWSPGLEEAFGAAPDDGEKKGRRGKKTLGGAEGTASR